MDLKQLSDTTNLLARASILRYMNRNKIPALIEKFTDILRDYYHVMPRDSQYYRSSHKINNPKLSNKAVVKLSTSKISIFITVDNEDESIIVDIFNGGRLTIASVTQMDKLNRLYSRLIFAKDNYGYKKLVVNWR